MLMLAYVLLVSSSHADYCYSKNCLANLRDVGDEAKVEPAMVVGTSGRKTEEKYAAANFARLSDVQNRFAATGRLNCNGHVLSANLTGANNVVTTAAHGIIEPRKCVTRGKIDKCTFTVKVGNVEKVRSVKRVMATGWQCPGSIESEDDWAVLILDKPLRM